MFKNFNWKRYTVHLIITWALFFVALGFVMEFKTIAREEAKAVNASHWIVLDIETRLREENERIDKLEQELKDLREDNKTLNRLNQQFASENIKLRRQLMRERLARKKQEES